MIDAKDLALESLSDALHYQLAQAKRREAVEAAQYADILVQLRRIQERAAELRSQHEPAATFSGGDGEVRAAILRAVRYVVYNHKEDV